MVLALSGPLAAATGLPPVEVPPVRDLGAAARLAEAGCRPLLLEFAAESCEYCDLLEEEILKPLLRNRDYDRRVLIRKVDIDDPETLKGFDGAPLGAAALAGRYDVSVTPTLLFLDSAGRELSRRMVGITTPEMYGWYLDQALDEARRKLRQGGRCPGDTGTPDDAG